MAHPMDPELAEVRAMWDRVAEGWRARMGSEGDPNHRHVSGPVVWRMLGEVRGLRVLDAGCGSGYLTAVLAARGARVAGVDIAPRMLAEARAAHPGLDFREDDLAALRTCSDAEFDLVLAHYVLMDAPDLDGALRAFARVLRPGGHVVAVFSHPCFPQGRARASADAAVVSYEFEFPYFGRHRLRDPPWGGLAAEFVWFHRPLSDYWKAFTGAGFEVVAFEEPRLGPRDEVPGADARWVAKARVRPYSVAFKLRKQAPPAASPS